MSSWNTLEACDVAHGVIALDDLHHVDDPACLEFLELLLTLGVVLDDRDDGAA